MFETILYYIFHAMIVGIVALAMLNIENTKKRVVYTVLLIIIYNLVFNILYY